VHTISLEIPLRTKIRKQIGMWCEPFSGGNSFGNERGRVILTLSRLRFDPLQIFCTEKIRHIDFFYATRQGRQLRRQSPAAIPAADVTTNRAHRTAGAWRSSESRCARLSWGLCPASRSSASSAKRPGRTGLGPAPGPPAPPPQRAYQYPGGELCGGGCSGRCVTWQRAPQPCADFQVDLALIGGRARACSLWEKPKS